MSDINYETVKAGLADTNPAMEALSTVLRQVAEHAAAQVGYWLVTTGVDPSTMPSEYFIQAMLVEAEKVFMDVADNDTWLRVFTAYKEVNTILEANPDLRAVREEALRKAHEAVRAPAPEDDVDALLKSIFQED